MKKLIVAAMLMLLLVGCGESGSSGSSGAAVPSIRTYDDNGSQIQFTYQADRINVIDYTNDKVQIAIRANSTDQYSIKVKDGLQTMNAQAGSSNMFGMFLFQQNINTYWYENGFDYISTQLSKFDAESYVELYINGIFVERYNLSVM